MEMLDFTPYIEPKVTPYGDVPEEMDIYYYSLEHFLPEGKTVQDLTEKEIEELVAKYQFSPYWPGIYQGITGFGFML